MSNCEHRNNLSAGRRVDSQRPVSSSTPAKVKIVEGPNVFSGVMGMPKKSHSSKNGRRLTEHSTEVDEISYTKLILGNPRNCCAESLKGFARAGTPRWACIYQNNVVHTIGCPTDDNLGDLPEKS